MYFIAARRRRVGRSAELGAMLRTLRLERRMAEDVVVVPAAARYRIENVAAFHPVMGHAGAVVRYAAAIRGG